MSQESVEIARTALDDFNAVMRGELSSEDYAAFAIRRSRSTSMTSGRFPTSHSTFGAFQRKVRSVGFFRERADALEAGVVRE